MFNNDDKNQRPSVFASRIRTLTVEELKHVQGAGSTGNQISTKPSSVDTDQAGRFQ